ncbi:hypothetical protein C2E20_1122 [Micractinium conductrix]|uniref:Uncharacterized protein n=1 Tax=Micractinium conductrix TaxID=554055 RepID=A0A2P6VMY1_9CHLO|nr:hypothetical protein C2E20_1122 [Micractinium conductrix]|eukprot:PSC75461.1 hypothetical protein C2E20_1122 [Micractinium conductrix]
MPANWVRGGTLLAAVLAGVLALGGAAVMVLRWRRRAARATADIRGAEQRARAAKQYGRYRQRFHRALAAAEDLEGANSSVFAAVSRKGAGGPATGGAAALDGAAGGVAGGGGGGAAAEVGGDGAQCGVAVLPSEVVHAIGGHTGAGAPAGGVPLTAPLGSSGGASSGGGGGSGVNPFLADVPGAAVAAAASALATADADEEEEGGDAFDPSSWDEDTRRQWDAFVSSSRVNKGKLWNSSQDVDSVANRALKEAARELERQEAAARQDHTIPKGGMAAEAQSAAAHRLHPEDSEVTALVRRRVAAELGGPDAEALANAIIEAAEARAARQPFDKRPHTVEEVLAAGAAELEHRESSEGKRHERHSLASRAQSAADRAARGKHPVVEDKVLEKLNQPGTGFCEG